MSAATLAAGPRTHARTGLLRVATAGSVDDGKSTLVGRLLFDAKAVLADTMEALTRTSLERGGSAPDLSLLVDGLRAEREQGITIDVAYRYLTTPRRDIVLIDTPGHVQYTRNTVTGASRADVGVLLVDARAGLLEQTRRHAAVMALLRVPHLVLAVNKIDLVDWSRNRFEEVADDFAAYAGGLGVPDVTAIPVSALLGDNVTVASEHLPWWDGPTLLGLLEEIEVPVRTAAGLRFPVQWVSRPALGSADLTRRYAGTVAAGVLRPGDDVVVLPSGRTTRVTAVETADGPLEAAGEGAAVVVQLADDLDVGRGDLLADPDERPEVTTELVLDVAVVGTRVLRAGDRVQVRHTGRLVRGLMTEVVDELDVATGERCPADALPEGALGRVSVRLAEPLAVDPYVIDRTTGALLLLDEPTGDVLAGGLVATFSTDSPDGAP